MCVPIKKLKGAPQRTRIAAELSCEGARTEPRHDICSGVPDDQVFGKPRLKVHLGPSGFWHIDVSTIKGLIIFVRCRHITSVRGCMITQGDHPIENRCGVLTIEGLP